MDRLEPDVRGAPDTDLEDADLAEAFTFARLDLTRLLDRQLLHLIAGLAIAIAVATWPERTDRVLARLIGIALIVVATSSAWASLRQRPRQLTLTVISLICIGIGTAIAAFPDQSVAAVGRLLAIALAIASCHSLVSTIRSRETERYWAWPIAKAGAGLATAALIAVYPTDLLAIAVAVLALGWAIVASVALAQSLRSDDGRTVQGGESRDIIVDWLDSRPKDAGDRRELYAKVLYEGPELRLRVIRFVTLMAFASVIAAMGVITDSTAVVIGAMLVAPLMTPLMGTAISVVMGWPNRLARSASIAAVGVAIAISVGIVLGLFVPTTIDIATNSQILARSTPTILDLITATAAGAAGAYGLSRPDVSDALPGVAIAISLVPPLSVVGIAWSQGAWDEGNGALLLFVTNALAIIVVGGATFIFTGVTPIRRVATNQRRVRTATASLVALGTSVVGALTLNGAEIATNAFEVNSVESAALDWVGESDSHSLIEADISGNVVTVVILGSIDDPPDPEDLHTTLVQSLGRPLIVDVRVLPQFREVHPEGALDDSGGG